MTKEAQPIEPVRSCSIAEFFELIPPNQLCNVSDLLAKRQPGATYYKMKLPTLKLHCESESCGGIRHFRCIDSDHDLIHADGSRDFYVHYICSNCVSTTKMFSMRALANPQGMDGYATKYGELPEFGPPTPPRLIKLIGPDRDIFLKGRRCENQGLGIGASIYYRRVVEHQKNRILEEIKKVSEKIGANPETIKLLDRAIAETRFSAAMEMAKDALPESLLLNGHNPLLLLHNALSEGVHEMNDAECLEQAQSIRVVLAELSERLAQALKDEAELTKALGKLMNRSAKPSESPDTKIGTGSDEQIPQRSSKKTAL